MTNNLSAFYHLPISNSSLTYQSQLIDKLKNGMSELENILDDALAEFDKDEEEVKISTEPNDTNKTTSDPPLPDFNEFVKVS